MGMTERLRGAGLFAPMPEGAFCVFPDFGSRSQALAARGITTSRELCERALADTGVAFLPGEAFGRDPRELTGRIAYVDFDGAEALSASHKGPGEEELDEAFLRRHCGRVLDAVDRLCGWVQG